MSVDRGGEAKAARRPGGPATEGNLESGPYPSGVVTVGYPVRAGGRVQGRADAVGSAVLSSPSPAFKVGDPVTVHLASCHDPQQHQRVTITGHVVERYLDGATLAVFPDGSQMLLCPWFTSDCPNSVPASQEAAA